MIPEGALEEPFFKAATTDNPNSDRLESFLYTTVDPPTVHAPK